MIQQERRRSDATESLWMLKFAIVAATTGVVASFLSDTATSVILFGAAAVAVAGFWWKFAVPFAQLTLSLKSLPKDLADAKKEREDASDKLVEIKEQQDEIAEHVLANESKIENLGRQIGRIERGTEISREQAADAVNIARAVQRAVGARARGDVTDDPNQ